MKHVPPVPLKPEEYRSLVKQALEEDLGSADVTSEALIDKRLFGKGVIVSMESCVVAGLDIACEVFHQVDPQIAATVFHSDGEYCKKDDVIVELIGSARAMLTAERTALNFIQRLSGIATLTRRFVRAASDQIIVLDTRKTTPLFRVLEKYAVRVGGGTNHRDGLYDGILIKDNHLVFFNSVANAVLKMKKASQGLSTEVEVQNLADVNQAIEAGAEIILLDNMTTLEIMEAVRICRGRAKVEISGGVTLERMRELVGTGAQYVSIGSLTHSAPAVDLSFEIEPI
jgi:nicotinate-nucleotide pyrophosphorylase (carboxylating)